MVKQHPGLRPHGRVDAEPTNGSAPAAFRPQRDMVTPFVPGQSPRDRELAHLGEDLRKRNTDGTPAEPPLSGGQALARHAQRTVKGLIDGSTGPHQAAILAGDLYDTYVAPTLIQGAKIVEQQVGPIHKKSRLGGLLQAIGGARSQLRQATDYAVEHPDADWRQVLEGHAVNQLFDGMTQATASHPTLTREDVGERGLWRGLLGILRWDTRHRIRRAAAQAASDTLRPMAHEAVVKRGRERRKGR